MFRKRVVRTLGEGVNKPNLLSLRYPKENTVVDDKQTTILILSTGESSVGPLSIRHLSALLIPAAGSTQKVWLINYPNSYHDFDIIRKYEKAIVELTQGKIARWETRFVALYSKKDIDLDFLLSFNLQFQRISLSGGGWGNFNFATRNCSDSVDFTLKNFFSEKTATPGPSRKDSILGFFCAPCFLLTCAASCVPRPVHPRFNNPLYVLREAKRLNSWNSETKEVLSEEKENNCDVCVNGCANCGAGMICLILTIACVPCYACPMTPASDFFGAGFFSFCEESKKNFRQAFSLSELQAPLIDPLPSGPNRQRMS